MGPQSFLNRKVYLLPGTTIRSSFAQGLARKLLQRLIYPNSTYQSYHSLGKYWGSRHFVYIRSLLDLCMTARHPGRKGPCSRYFRYVILHLHQSKDCITLLDALGSIGKRSHAVARRNGAYTYLMQCTVKAILPTVAHG